MAGEEREYGWVPWLQPGMVLVFDSAPLINAATGIVHKALSAASFIQNDYRKARRLAESLGVRVEDLADRLRGEYLRQIARKLESEDKAEQLIMACAYGRARCLVPSEVARELEKHAFSEEVRDFLKLTGGPLKRVSLVAEWNAIARRMGRGEYSRRPKTIDTRFFERLAGPAFTWGYPDLARLAEESPTYRKWLAALTALANKIYKGLSPTDVAVLAYTAYLNEQGTPAVAVIADRRMMQLAEHTGIPYYYVYHEEPGNTENLARLSLAEATRRILQERGRKKRGARTG